MRSFFLVAAAAFLASSVAVVAADNNVPQLHWIDSELAAGLVVSPPSTTTAADVLQAHYGSPADGCEADEMQFQISGVPGAICAPKCTDTPCPTDVPDGVTAAPTCALKNPATGDKYCVLLCTPSSSSSSSMTMMLRAPVQVGDGQCGEATCQPVQGAGVCTYGA